LASNSNYSIWDNNNECVCSFQSNEEGGAINARRKAVERLKLLNQQGGKTNGKN
jgi:hypothetical protein